MEDIRDAIEKKINRLPVSYFDAQETGDLLSRITNDVETVSNALQQTLSRVIGAVCTFVFVSIMMCTINLVMTLMVYVALPVIAMISFGFVKSSRFRHPAAVAGGFERDDQRIVFGFQRDRHLRSAGKSERPVSKSERGDAGIGL